MNNLRERRSTLGGYATRRDTEAAVVAPSKHYLLKYIKHLREAIFVTLLTCKLHIRSRGAGATSNTGARP